MTLVVNSPFQAELSVGADLSHAQLGVEGGGRGQGGSWHRTLESLLPVPSLAGEKRTTVSVPGQSDTDFQRRFQSIAKS